MKIDHEFTVSVPIERAWAVLTDLEAIAPCMPGAQLTGVDGDVYSGKVKIKVGPVVSQYAGTVKFLEKDDANYRAVIDAKGRDSRGAGNASAAITAQLRPDGDRTHVSVDTDLKITGRIAQFGSGMIKEVSNKLLGQFVASLEQKLLADAGASDSAEPGTATAATEDKPKETAATEPSTATADAEDKAKESGTGTATAEPGKDTDAGTEAKAADAAAPAAESSTGTADKPEETTTTAPAASAETKPAEKATEPTAKPAATGARVITPAEEAEPLDVLSLAGNSIYKRVIPLVIALVVIVALIVFFVVS
jgi:Uncharacterized conserved protein